ncbi:MAG: restriction endonuclease subunit S [Phycisphaerales bacterium]
MKLTPAKLGELLSVKHGFAFKSEYFDSEGPFVLMTPGHFHDVGGFRDQGEKTKYYTGDVPNGYLLDEGELLVAMTEQMEGLLGSSALVPEAGRYLHNQRLGRIVDLDETRLNKRYLYYLFNTREVRAQITSSASGTKVRHTSPSRIGEVTVDIPAVAVQSRVAEILAAYDKLIENNTRRIKLLEDAARLLYDEWFVRLRFPGREHTPIRDGLPKGWGRKLFSEVCETVGGGTPSTKVAEYWDGDITWVVPSDITRNDCLALLDSERHITEKGLRESSATLVPPETILMTSRASVGFFALVDREVCTNQGFINVIPHADHMRMYVLFNLMNRVEEIRSNAKGTTYPEISKGRFRGMDVVVPSESLTKAFSETVYPMVRQVRCLKKQAVALRKARDLLLPRLMSGEVVV